MASETGTKSVSGSAPVTGQTSTATTTLYYRSFTDRETGAAAEPEIYYNTAATGNVVRDWNGNGNYNYDWSVNIAENQFATQSEKIYKIITFVTFVTFTFILFSLYNFRFRSDFM